MHSLNYSKINLCFGCFLALLLLFYYINFEEIIETLVDLIFSTIEYMASEVPHANV